MLKKIALLLAFLTTLCFGEAFAACSMGACSTAGQMRYASNVVQTCNGSIWINVAEVTSGCEASLSISPGNQTGMDVAGAGAATGVFKSGSNVTFTITNNGVNTSGALAPQLSGNSTEFTFGTNNCSGATLASGASCTVQVKPYTDRDKSLAATFQIANHNTPSVTLAGTASGWASLASCAAGTTGPPNNKCILDATPHGGTSGECFDGPGVGDCSATCNDGTWNVTLLDCTGF